MPDTDQNSARPKKKKGINAKIVKHAHRRRFQEYVRTKGRDKSTIAYVYWSMYLRSGAGNVFELEEGLFLGDLGIGKNALRPARKALVDDGWLSKAPQKVDPLTGKWGTTAWTVNTEPAALSKGDGTVAPLTGDRSADIGSAGDRSAGDTVVLHPLYASNPEASTSPVTLKGVTSPESQSASKSVGAETFEEEKPNPSERITEEKTEPTPTPNPDEEMEPVFCEMLDRYIGEPEVLEELGKCFPAFKSSVKPTAQEKRLMAEIIVHCTEWAMFPREAMDFARKHKQDAPALIPRTVKGFHKAVFEGSSTNGLLAQTKEHDPATCGLCKKELSAMPCAHCNGTTYGKPIIEHGKPFCGDCMKLPSYRRHPTGKSYLEASI